MSLGADSITCHYSDLCGHLPIINVTNYWPRGIMIHEDP